MMGWFVNKHNNAPEELLFDRNDGPVFLRMPERVKFIELQGAMAYIDDETGKLEFRPRGPISISIDKIGAYYDNTIILFGNKIRVMESAHEIEMMIREAQQ